MLSMYLLTVKKRLRTKDVSFELSANILLAPCLFASSTNLGVLTGRGAAESPGICRHHGASCCSPGHGSRVDQHRAGSLQLPVRTSAAHTALTGHRGSVELKGWQGAPTPSTLHLRRSLCIPDSHLASHPPCFHSRGRGRRKMSPRSSRRQTTRRSQRNSRCFPKRSLQGKWENT